MARIQRDVARERLQSPGVPQVSVDMTTGAALERAGNALTGALTTVMDHNKKRADEKASFAATNGYQRLKLELADDLRTRSETMPEDGTGFHDDFVANVFQPKRDAFLASIKDLQLRERYNTLLSDPDPSAGNDGGADAVEWSTKAAALERDAGYAWAGRQLEELQGITATAINTDPDGYDRYLQQGLDAISEAPLPTAEKVKARKVWEQTAQVAWLDRTLASDPAKVLRALNADPSAMPPNARFDMLSQAVRSQETGGELDPARAVSPKGALGVMQVMPDTARDIAKALGDSNFPTNGTQEDVTEYLFREDVNRRYGEYYLRQQLRAFGGDMEAALVAYNGGPKRAQEWLAAGRDDSVIPKETRDYYKEVMQRLPGGTPFRNGQAQFVWSRGGANEPIKAGDKHFANVNPALQQRVQYAFSSLGLKEIRINSAFRDEAHNRSVGGAKNSQHLHGKAFDIDVSSYSREDRRRIIAALSAAGITGIGVGNSIIHADIGTRRAWGYDTSGKVSSVPGWAAGTIKQHLAGGASLPAGAGGPSGQADGVQSRFATLPYDTRQKYIASASKAVVATQKATELQKYEVKREVKDELARYLETGEGSQGFDDSRIASTLGADDYAKFVRDRDVNRTIYMGKLGMTEMTDEEMAQRIDEYKADPSSPLYTLDQQRVEDALVKESSRITRLRASSPAQAAVETPDLSKTWEEIRAKEEVPPDERQAFVRAMLDKQATFNVAPSARQPVPREWSLPIGRSFAKVMPAGPDRSSAEVAIDVMQMYQEVQKQYGEFADEVIIQALTDYQGLDEGTADMVTGMMKALQVGGDPFRGARRALEGTTEKVEQSEGGRSFLSWIFGSREDDATDETAAETQPSGAAGRRARRMNSGEATAPETGARAQGAASAAGARGLEPTASNAEKVDRAARILRDDDSAATRAAVIRRFGQEVFDAALRVSAQ